MNRTAPDAPITTTVSALSDWRLLQQLKHLTAVEHQLEIVVIDHLRELERRRLFLTLGCSSLFDYATRELGYSEAAAWRRIKAMRLCGEVEGARERMRDGSLTLNSAALLQNAFDRQEHKHAGGGRGAQAGVRPAATLGAPAQTGERAEEAQASPVLDSSARQALVEQAAGKSTRQVEKLLAGVDPELTAPADRMRPLGAGRWELKAVIDDDCRSGLEQLKGLLSHVDPHLTLGQLVGRVVREAVERHDPARPPRGRRTGSKAAAGGTYETSAPKDASGPDSVAAPTRSTAMPAGVTTSAAKARASSPNAADCEHAPATAAKRPGATIRPSAPKDATGRMPLRLSRPNGRLRPAAQLRQRRHQQTPGAPYRRNSLKPLSGPPLRRRRRNAAGKPHPRHRGPARASLWRRLRSPWYVAAPSRPQSSGRSGSATWGAAATWTGTAGATAALGICCRSITSFRSRSAAAPSPTISGCCAPPITATATQAAAAGRTALPPARSPLVRRSDPAPPATLFVWIFG